MRCVVSYVTIDFETAYRGKGSACALGISTGNGQELQEEWYRLIKPYSMRFDVNCVRVNGIYPDMVENEKPFSAYWADIACRLEGNIVFAHNARFDMGVLSDVLDLYDLPDIHFRYGDTVEVARKLWSHLPNHRLGTVAEFLCFSFHHHQAMDDANACEWIVRQALREVGTDSVEEMMRVLKLPLKPFIVKRSFSGAR